ncbi:MAG: FecR domain-containing protein [Agriterribacter sp.]
MNPNSEINVGYLLTDETFVNYLKASNIHDVNYWKEWIESNPQYTHIVNEARELHFALDAVCHSSTDTRMDMASEDLARFKKLLKKEATAKVGRIRRFVIACSAAAAVLIIAAGIWRFKSEQGKARYQFYASADSTIRNVVLSDGTTVLLNRNASISLDEQYNAKDRRILLKGSAFFKVTRQPSKPLSVLVQNVSTTALGTEFYIHEDTQTEAVTVSLLEGSVQVANAKNTTRLMPGQRAMCGKTSFIQKTEFLQDQLFEWTTGKVVLKQADFAEIIGVLRMYYNLTVEVSSYPGKMKFTGSFNVNRPDELLESLAFSYGLHYKRNGYQLFIESK